MSGPISAIGGITKPSVVTVVGAAGLLPGVVWIPSQARLPLFSADNHVKASCRPDPIGRGKAFRSRSGIPPRTRDRIMTMLCRGSSFPCVRLPAEGHCFPHRPTRSCGLPSTKRRLDLDLAKRVVSAEQTFRSAMPLARLAGCFGLM